VEVDEIDALIRDVALETLVAVAVVEGVLVHGRSS
jgi:hypothetical protein